MVIFPKAKDDIYRPNVVEPKQTAEVRDTVYDNIQLPAVIQAYHMPAQGTKDYYALSMLTTLLTGGESSRLSKRLVDKEKLALGTQSIPLNLEDPSVFLLFAVANFGRTNDEIEKVIDEEVEKVKSEYITDDEFTKIRSQVETNFIEKNSTVQGKAMQLGNYYVFFRDANLINSEIDKYMAVTKSDIQRVAKEYLVKENRTVLYYLPKTNVQ